MFVSPIVIAIFISILRCLDCAVRNDDVSNYFSSYILRDYRNPIVDGVSVVDSEENKTENKDDIVEGIQNKILPQFSTLNLTQPLKTALLKDYYLTKPFTKGDVSNLYNLDFLGSGLVDSKINQKGKLWSSRPNYSWLNRNITWPNLPNLWNQQSLKSDLFPKMNSSGYNLCNNHMSHSDLMGNDSIKVKRSLDLQKTVDLKPIESKELLTTNRKDFIRSKYDLTALKKGNSSSIPNDLINRLNNLTSNIVQRLPSLSDLYVSKSEKDLTKLFNSFNTSSLLKKYEKSQKSFK